jgi:inhibitor of KinA
MAKPHLVPVVDRAVLVELGSAVGPDVQALVWALDRALRADPVPGQVELVPAMVNLLVVFDPLRTDHGAVATAVEARLGTLDVAQGSGAQREVLVCYDAPFGRDLGAVAEDCNLAAEAVVAAHLAGDYRVSMYGFAPGYAYLAGVPDAIRRPRKAAPVRAVPAGSVIIAGGQCLVTTLTMPTGWWVIGRSPTRILTGEVQRPFLFDVGDRVRFRRISAADMAAMETMG